LNKVFYVYSLSVNLSPLYTYYYSPDSISRVSFL
jgi:hypothetical protein